MPPSLAPKKVLEVHNNFAQSRDEMFIVWPVFLTSRYKDI